ncbi:putative Genome sequencing data, contig C327 [Candidatus Magnetomoraceae bacterium gMMP-15]
MIEKYFLQIEHIIQEFPNIRSLSLKKKIYNVKQGFISGSLIFENGYRLDFAEVRNTDVKAKIKYRYQYMKEDMESVFRYDNAPHHPDIKTFPHHKHQADGVKASDEPSFFDVLTEITQRQRKSQMPAG